MSFRKSIVCGCVIEKDGKFLLVQEAKKRVEGMWNLPRGKIEKPEDLISAAKREVKEETGFDVSIKGLLNITNLVLEGENRIIIIFNFLGEIIGGEENPKEGEIKQIKWLTLEEVKKMDENKFRGDTKKAILSYKENKKNLIPLEKIFRDVL